MITGGQNKHDFVRVCVFFNFMRVRLFQTGLKFYQLCQIEAFEIICRSMSPPFLCQFSHDKKIWNFTPSSSEEWRHPSLYGDAVAKQLNCWTPGWEVRFGNLAGSLWCNLGQNTLLPQSLSPPTRLIGCRWTVMKILRNTWGNLW